jgi:hypothetical protein
MYPYACRVRLTPQVPQPMSGSECERVSQLRPASREDIRVVRDAGRSYHGAPRPEPDDWRLLRGVFYLLTFAFSIPAFFLYEPVLADPE